VLCFAKKGPNGFYNGEEYGCNDVRQFYQTEEYPQAPVPNLRLLSLNKQVGGVIDYQRFTFVRAGNPNEDPAGLVLEG